MSIDKETAEIIVRICFMVKDLKYPPETNDFSPPKELAHGGMKLKRKLNALLGSSSQREFSEQLTALKSSVGHLIVQYEIANSNLEQWKVYGNILIQLNNALKTLKTDRFLAYKNDNSFSGL